MKTVAIKKIKDHYVPVSSGLGNQLQFRNSHEQSTFSSYCRMPASHRSSRVFGW